MSGPDQTDESEKNPAIQGRPSLDRLYAAREQPGESDEKTINYLTERPQTVRFLDRLRQLESLIRGKAAKKNERG